MRANAWSPCNDMAVSMSSWDANISVNVPGNSLDPTSMDMSRVRKAFLGAGASLSQQEAMVVAGTPLDAQLLNNMVHRRVSWRGDTKRQTDRGSPGFCLDVTQGWGNSQSLGLSGGSSRPSYVPAAKRKCRSWGMSHQENTESASMRLEALGETEIVRKKMIRFEAARSASIIDSRHEAPGTTPCQLEAILAVGHLQKRSESLKSTSNRFEAHQ